MDNQNVKRDVVIIGSGPAGLTAAIYTARANLKPLLIDAPADAEKQTDRIAALAPAADKAVYADPRIRGIMTAFRKG